jgi:hypothetical protein
MKKKGRARFTRDRNGMRTSPMIRGLLLAQIHAARLPEPPATPARRKEATMSVRLTGITLASAIVIAFGNISTAEAQLLGSGPLSVPITGSVTGGGSFVGTLSIQRFAVSGGATVAVAAIAGAVVDGPGGGRTGVRSSVSLPVTVTAAVGAAYRPQGSRFDRPGFVLARQGCGGNVNVAIGGSTINVMGVQVALDPVVLDVGANQGGLVGSLVCQLLSALNLNNPTMIVGLLNSLLVQLVPLLGLLGGGLLL